MKRLLSFLSLAFLTSNFLFAQTQEPVKWAASYKTISATEGEILITATIDKNWHTYSMRPTKDGPIPTSFTFTPTKDYEVEGKTIESEAHEEFVKAFDAKVFIFSNKAEFRQKVKVKKAGAHIPIKVEFMCCNDMMCLPPKTIDLSVSAR